MVSKEPAIGATHSQSALFQFPDFEALRLGLNSALTNDRYGRGPADILTRKASKCSTYPTEIVTCRLGDGVELRLHCKYSGGISFETYGHRGGVAYEAEVYRHVLQPIEVSTPRFYGAYQGPSGNTWLFLEHLDKGLRVSRGPQPQTNLRIAEWLGRFHAINEGRLSDSAMSFLNRYDADYYLGWVRRTSIYASELHQRFPWLRVLCGRAKEFVDLLLSAPPTVIHGEFYGGNLIYRRGMVHPVDWESAAIAPGEIDLACMTEDWDDDTVRMCTRSYQKARWPTLPALDFERTFAAARLYLLFRWMGDQPEWTTEVGNSHYFEDMRSLGKQLGLL